MAPFHPSSVAIMVAWIQQVAGIPHAAATLPSPEGWFDTGFVTVPAVVGGNPDIYVPERRPVLQVDCWAATRAATGAKSASRKPPLLMANALAETIVLATYPTPVPTITLPAQYLPVWVGAVYPVSEVRRIPEPTSGLAHFSVDIALEWIERNPVI
jgi:hypothetical protein